MKWVRNGMAFMITNKHLFVQKVMLKIAKHKSFPSFVRQLCKYNFKK